MADEYIRLDTTIIAIDNLINEDATGTMARTLFKAKDTIYNQQRYVIAVQSVKHGRWIDCTFYDPYEKSYEQNFEYKCSCCGHMIYNEPNDDNLYCGHCGARMDLKDGDTE